MTTAIVNMKTVASHCPVAAVSPRSVMITGIATLMIVSLRITTKEETSSSVMTSRVRAGSRAGAAGRVGGGTADARCSDTESDPARLIRADLDVAESIRRDDRHPALVIGEL